MIVALLLFSGQLIERRGRVRRLTEWLAWSAAAAALVIAGCRICSSSWRAGSARQRRSRARSWRSARSGSRRRSRCRRGADAWGRRLPQRQPAQFFVEQLLAGFVAAAALYVLVQVLRGRITAAAIDRWQFPLFPIDPDALLYLSGLLVAQLALCWTAAAAIAVAALRWRVTWRRPGTGLLAMVLWTAPSLALAVIPDRFQPLPMQALVGAAAGLALFGVLAESIRRSYRRTTQAMRLILVFAAMLLPHVRDVSHGSPC